ncbi:MAG: hypothetical protein HXY26_03820 [Hydrogenophilaceae bacterium]|nr:hypothetical protein [Hydrogenophilaceae bacterium]
MPKTEDKPSKKTTSKTETAAKPKKAASSVKAATATKTTAAKATTASKPKKAKALDADLRHKLITETAHFLSEKRCCGASEMDDWLFAEQLVDGVSGAISKS